MKLAATRILTGPRFRRIFRPIMRDRATIFMLHRMSDPAAGIHGHSIDDLRAVLEELARSGARFISLREMLEQWRTGHHCDPDAIAFTMDDGFADQGTLAREAFIPLGCPVTIFLITDFLDGRLWPWDDQLAFAIRQSRATRASIRIGGRSMELDLGSARARDKALHQIRSACKRTDNSMLYRSVASVAESLGVSLPDQAPPHYLPITWNEARELEEMGVEFGPHSVTHRIFSGLPDDMARAEIERSWHRLQQELRRPAPILAWPTGRSADFTPRDMRFAREMGLLGCVATDSDYAHFRRGDADSLFCIRRFPLPDNLATTLRYGSWLERARQLLPA